jgi:hypothetical protein
VSSPAASTTSWSELNAFYEANAAASLQAIQDAYADVTLLTPPHSPDFIFPGTAPDYIYNPLLTAEERNATPPYSPVPYALLELAKEALRRQQLDEEDGSPLPTLQYPPLEAFVPDKEIPVEELLPPQVFTPIAVVPSPVPESPILHQGPAPAVFPIIEPAVLLLHRHFNESPVIPAYNEADLYPHLFSTPPCTADTRYHPHQYTVSFQNGENVWTLQEEFVNRDFLRLIPYSQDLTEALLHFVTPFRAQVFHTVSIPSTGPLPPIFLCAKVGRHTYSAPFPFGCLESSFIDSIKDKFSQVPTEWLAYFEGALVPLVSYDFLDGRTITLCGHLHFMDRGILIVRRTTRTEDTLRTQPELARFVCTPRVPTNPFDFIIPPPLELTL